MNRQEYEAGLTAFAKAGAACEQYGWLLDEPMSRAVAEETLKAHLSTAVHDLADATDMTVKDASVFVDAIVAAARLQIKLDLQAYFAANGSLWLPTADPRPTDR